jgi:hypothetical protein
MTLGSAPKYCVHVAWLSTITGAAEGSSSVGVNVRPTSGDAPSTSKKVPETALHDSLTGLVPGIFSVPDQLTAPTSAMSSKDRIGASRSRRAE